MTLGITPATGDLFRSARELCEPKLSATSVYRLLADLLAAAINLQRLATLKARAPG